MMFTPLGMMRSAFEASPQIRSTKSRPGEAATLYVPQIICRKRATGRSRELQVR